MSNLASHKRGAVNINSKKQKRLATTRELMGNVKKRIDSFSELEKDLENLGIQRRMKQLELENKFPKTNDETV